MTRPHDNEAREVPAADEAVSSVDVVGVTATSGGVGGNDGFWEQFLTDDGARGPADLTGKWAPPMRPANVRRQEAEDSRVLDGFVPKGSPVGVAVAAADDLFWEQFLIRGDVPAGPAGNDSAAARRREDSRALDGFVPAVTSVMEGDAAAMAGDGRFRGQRRHDGFWEQFLRGEGEGDDRHVPADPTVDYMALLEGVEVRPDPRQLDDDFSAEHFDDAAEAAPPPESDDDEKLLKLTLSYEPGPLH